METTMVCWGYIGIMQKKMEASASHCFDVICWKPERTTRCQSIDRASAKREPKASGGQNPKERATAELW